MKKTLTGIILVLIVVFLSAPFVVASEILIATPEEISGTDVQQIEWENVVHYLLFSSPIRFKKDFSKVKEFVDDKNLVIYNFNLIISYL